MITIDILDRSYAKKLFEGVSSGYKSSTVTDNADGSKTLTINFVNGDKANITFNPVKGDKGEQGLQGDKGDKGDKGDTGLGIDSIDVKESSLDNGENIFTITLTDGTSKSFKILNGSKGSKGDTGISLDDVKLVKDITDKTNHLQVKFDNETSYTDLGRVQGKSNYEIALDNGFVGNEDEYLKSLTAQTTESKIVTSKPRIEDDTTALGVWYYWQDNKEGTTDTAYKYRLDIPSTQDLGHGKYCFYYNLKWFTSETTQDVKALTNKDTYKYYLVMNLLDVSYDIIQETIADGTATVLEHVTGDISATTPTSDYTPISSSALSMLGVQCQTLYIGATKETANEVTIRTGTDVKDFITSGSFQSIIGNKSDLSTLNNDNIVSAINEVKSDLDEHTNDTDIHITSAERTKWNNVDNKADKTDLTSHASDTNIHVTTSDKTKWNKVDNKFDKTDITTTINSTSTDTQVPSAKAVYNLVGNENRRGYIFNNPTCRGNKWNRVFKVDSLFYCNSGFLTVTVYSNGLCEIATFLMSKNFNRLNIKQINCGGYNGDNGQGRPIKVRIIGAEHSYVSFLEIYVSGTSNTNVVATYMPLSCNSVVVLNEEGSIPNGMFACEMTATHDTYENAIYTSVLK